MARVVRYTFAGGLGAVIAWLLMEWTRLMPESKTPGVEPVIPYGYLFVVGLVSGLLIGLGLGIASSISGLSPRDATRTVMMGALVGAAGGIVGITVGNALYNALYSLGAPSALGPSLPGSVPAEARPAYTPKPLAFILLLIGRGFGWALIGLFIGLSQGIATNSTRKMTNGAVGGFLGGGIGGTVFELLVWMNRGGVANFPPEMIRFISFAITGAAIGLFVGFVEEVTKKAWIIRLLGRNEGREYVVFKPITLIGRTEFADIPIFDDPDVAAEHAKITAAGRRHTIQDLGSTFGTTVNGQKVVQPEVLRDGDEIVVGKTRLLFRDKATARPGYVPAATAPSGPVIPTSAQVCQFCGGTKDASGKCGCTVAAAPTVGTQPAASGARLVAVVGPYQGQTFILKSGETQIGRDATKDIALSMDNTVSRNHARIAQEVTGYVIYDLGSTNGTFVNNQRITQQKLTNGDTVQVGSTKLRFEV